MIMAFKASMIMAATDTLSSTTTMRILADKLKALANDAKAEGRARIAQQRKFGS